MPVKFDCSKDDHANIREITTRAMTLSHQFNVNVEELALNMDITACHANGCPLDLQKLLAADDFNFTHDVFGISRHLNRKTGQLEDCFVPRCAIPRPSYNSRFYIHTPASGGKAGKGCNKTSSLQVRDAAHCIVKTIRFVVADPASKARAKAQAEQFISEKLAGVGK